MPDTNDDSDLGQTSAETTKSFHLEEFKALKAEIESDTARTVRITQYVLLVSAISYSVSLGITESAAKPSHQTAVILLFFPLLCSAIGAIICIGTAIGIGRKGRYIKRLERRMARNGFGWERFNERPRWMTGLTTIIPWAAICIINALIPLLWWRGVIALSVPPSQSATAAPVFGYIEAAVPSAVDPVASVVSTVGRKPLGVPSWSSATTI